MNVDSLFIDPIKEFHPILRIVEMPQVELMALLPLRINRFCLVRYPYAESFGFPIDMPNIKGDKLLKLHIAITSELEHRGIQDVTVSIGTALGVLNPLYNTFVKTKDIYTLKSADGSEPVVVYNDELYPVSEVERHINALAIYCNTVNREPTAKVANILPNGYTVNATGTLISNGAIHGRYDFSTACDLLYTCILNYMRL